MQYQDEILQGESLSVLKGLPDGLVDCIMTSPPYWGLRDYGVKGQLGLEKTFDEYINKLCNIFDEVKRVLKNDGTCWVNLGDTYSSGIGNNGGYSNKSTLSGYTSEQTKGRISNKSTVKLEQTLPDKCLCNIPARFSTEMCNRGWILRNVIIWHKNNCMPSSVQDRFTVDFEYLFFFVKQKQYYFEQQREKTGNEATWEEYNKADHRRHFHENDKEKGMLQYNPNYKTMTHPDGKNKRTVWTINPKPYSEAHFAVYPEELCWTPIKAGCPEKGLVLDMFFGSGTSGLAAKNLGRNYLGIELNPEYIKIARKRLRQLYMF